VSPQRVYRLLAPVEPARVRVTGTLTTKRPAA
jgi:hypothetical protein